MIHHLALTTADLDRSSNFYDELLGVLGYARTIRTPDLSAWEGPEPEILLYAAEDEQVNNAHRTYDPGIHHVAFETADKGVVDRAAEVAVRAGGRLLDAPRFYPDYAPGYYAAYFEDPDGIKLEVMTR